MDDVRTGRESSSLNEFYDSISRKDANKGNNDSVFQKVRNNRTLRKRLIVRVLYSRH